MSPKKFITTILLALSMSFIKGQDADFMVHNFTALVSGNSIVLDWEIIAGNTCNGTQIYRSDDNFTWEQIGEIPGICGSVVEPVPYQWTDNSPINNAINYYKLELGSVGFTSSVSISYIALGDAGYAIAPNPITATGNIFFRNSNGLEYTLIVTDLMGNLLIYKEGIRTDFVTIDRSGLEAGYYFFTLEQGGEVRYSGTMVFN